MEIFNQLDGIVFFNGLEIPKSNTPGYFNTKGQIDRHEDYLKAAGLEIKDSTIPHAGKGLFSTKERLPGASVGFYFGDYLINRGPKKHDSTIRLGAGSGWKRDGELYLKGHRRCPVGFINDPSWRTRVNKNDKSDKFNVNCEFVENNHLPYSAVNYVEVLTTAHVEVGSELFIDYNLTDATMNRRKRRRRGKSEAKVDSDSSGSGSDSDSSSDSSSDSGSDSGSEEKSKKKAPSRAERTAARNERKETEAKEPPKVPEGNDGDDGDDDNGDGDGGEGDGNGNDNDSDWEKEWSVDGNGATCESDGAQDCEPARLTSLKAPKN